MKTVSDDPVVAGSLRGSKPSDVEEEMSDYDGKQHILRCSATHES